MSGYRNERIEKQIRTIIADTLLKEIMDPRIGFVTVTNAKLNRDKTIVFVSVSIMGNEKSKKDSMIGLNSAKGFFQYKIGSGIKMRNTPKIVFQVDPSIENGLKMINTLDNLEKQRINESGHNQNPEDD
jgi:ribosome-binding factor A